MIDYKDEELKEEKQSLYLAVAGFTIKLTFEPVENVFFKRKLIEDIWDVWGKGGFLGKERVECQYELRFRHISDETGTLKRSGGKDYLLTFIRPREDKMVETFYHIGVASISFILREIVGEIIKKDGLVIHASSVLDSKGMLYAFTAESGAGKTTAADTLCKNKNFIKFSDDNLFVRKIKGEWVYFSPCFIEKGSLPKKQKAKKAKLFFIKKGKKVKSSKLKEKGLLKRILSQVWLKEENIEGDIIRNAMEFTKDNDFYYLTTNLSAKEMRKAVYEA